MVSCRIKYSKVTIVPVLALAVILGLTSEHSILYSANAQSIQGGVDDFSTGNYRGARLQWESMAVKGDTQAMFLLARLYRQGLGVAADIRQAEKLYRLAADRGHTAARGNLATSLYFNGNGGTDIEKATRLWREAAEAGDARSQYMMAVSNYNGDGLPLDQILGYAWIRLALDQGLKEAEAAELAMRRELTIEQLTRGRLMAPTLTKPSPAVGVEKRPVLLAELRASGVTDTTGIISPITPTEAPVTPVISSPSPSSDAEISPASASGDAESAAPEVDNVPIPAPVATPPTEFDALGKLSVADSTIASWGLQLGAFSSEEIAQSQWRGMTSRFADALAGSVVEITPLERVQGILYRLRSRGFASRADAELACNLIQAAGSDCFVVAPEPK